MIVLGVETSCDDTAAAIVENGRSIRANLVSSQDAVHAPYGGIVPEIASRQHIHTIQPMVDRALQEAGVVPADLDGLAVTYGPGLTGSLLVGLSFVKGWSFSSGITYVGVNHLEAHVLSIFLEMEVSFPYVALVASGGHTLLYVVDGFGDYRFLGGTLDDAAGEAYDKVAKMMGLGFPGGRVIDDLAKKGDPCAITFPRARLRTPYDFSFSGLKTSVWHYLTRKQPDRWQDQVVDIAASFQEAAVDMLINPTLRAVEALGIKRIVLGGGVSANSRLREKMTEKALEVGAMPHYPSPRFCTDNGAMVALVGSYRLEQGERSGPSLNADSALIL